METTKKVIPFNFYLARQIHGGNEKGKILTRAGGYVRNIVFNVRNDLRPISAIIQTDWHKEDTFAYKADGTCIEQPGDYDLVLEVDEVKNIEQQNEPTPEQMDKNITELIFDNGQTDHKNDRKDNKLPWELLPIEVIEEAVKVYQFGAEKYGVNTWQKLENGKERYYAALMRHLVAWRKGETKDEESQLHPLSHVIWNAIALLWFEMNEGKNNGKIQNTEG